MAYDSLGRKTSMTEPNMGTWTYEYDNAGRLIEQVDARGNKLKFFFEDELGRMTRKEVCNSGGQLTATATYTYDESDDPNFTVFKGQLYKVTDSEGTQRNSYDVRGRVMKSARLLKINAMEYVTETVYDDADRVVQVVYPNNAAAIKYTYDTAGNLSEVRSLTGTGTQEIFYSSPTFNELGQLTSYVNGAGTLTAYTFYPNSKRLKQIQVSNGSTVLQDLTYTFDKVSNVKGIGDGVYSGGASAGLSDIQYDDLHRLVSLNSVARGTKSYQYNAIGNMLLNQDYGGGTYQYGSAKPHAVTSANGKSYAYDACGNMIQRGDQTLIYDEQNRLIQAGNVRFGYADSGARLWRAGTNGHSVWIGGIYEINNGKVLCHVFANGQRIASFEPQCGGPWSKVIGEERYYAFASRLERVFNWPFQNGRAPFTVIALTFLGMAGVSLAARRQLPLKRRVRRHVLPLLPDKPSGVLHSLLPLLLRRRRGLGRGGPPEDRDTLRVAPSLLGRLWRQAVSFASIAALLFATTPNVHAQSSPSLFRYYHADHLGSSNIVTNREGQRVQHYGYAAFGKTAYVEDASAFPDSHRYTGQILDEETACTTTTRGITTRNWKGVRKRSEMNGA